MLEKNFKNIHRFLPYNRKVIIQQIESFLKSDSLKKEIIGEYTMITFNDELFVVRTDKKVYKSFSTVEDYDKAYSAAVDYCLDKMNSENKQLEIL